MKKVGWMDLILPKSLIPVGIVVVHFNLPSVKDKSFGYVHPVKCVCVYIYICLWVYVGQIDWCGSYYAFRTLCFSHIPHTPIDDALFSHIIIDQFFIYITFVLFYLKKQQTNKKQIHRVGMKPLVLWRSVNDDKLLSRHDWDMVIVVLVVSSPVVLHCTLMWNCYRFYKNKTNKKYIYIYQQTIQKCTMKQVGK